MGEHRIKRRTVGWLSGLIALLGTTSALAEPVPADLQLLLGKPATTTTVRVLNGTHGVDILIGTGRHTLEGVQANAVEAESVALTGGGSLGLMTIRAEAAAYLAVVGRKRGRAAVIWSGVVGLRGDPGERRGHVVIRSDRNGDGIPELAIAEQHEAVRSCDGGVPWVRARWIDPATLDFQRDISEVEVSASQTPEVPILAATQAPAATREHPQIQVLRSQWSTSSNHGEVLSDLPESSSMLDRERLRPWDGGQVEQARAVFGVRGSGLPVRQLALDVPSGAGGEFRFRGDGGDWFHVTLPPTNAPTSRYWVALPSPAHWTCLELAAAERDGRMQPIPPIAELEAFTEIDADDGAAQLVARVITDERRGAETAALLASLGEPGISALRDNWERLGPQGQRRTVTAVADRAATSGAARAILAAAASASDGDLAARALSALIRHKDSTISELTALANTPGSMGREATLAIGQSGRPEALGALLQLLATSRGERADVRQALGVALAGAGAEGVPQVESWLQTDVPVTALASSLLVLAGNAPTSALASTLWERLVQQPLEFPELWRTILASRSLPASPAIDQWLATQAKTPGIAWMIRDAALTSLQLRSSDLALAIAEEARNDESPRVRATAIAVLGADPVHRAQLPAGLAEEPWPLARVAILNQVAGLPESSAILGRAVRDPAVRVRIAAIEGLAHTGVRESWAVLAERLTDENEWPAVMAAVIHFAGALCITEATSDLRAVIKRGIKPNAWAPDVDLAMEAIAVLGQLGTDEARRLLTAVQAPDQLPAFRDAAKRAASEQVCHGVPGPNQQP